MEQRVELHRLIGWSDVIRKQMGDPRPRIEQEDLERDIAAIETKLGEAAYEVAYGCGQGMALDEAAALALSVSKQT